jgi:hypothetical protein
VVVFHLLLFYVLGSEPRRQAVIMPFMIMFCVLGINWFVSKVKKTDMIKV